VRQNSITFCQTILDDDLPMPSTGDLEQAYHIAGPKQYKGRLRDVFMILTDDHFNKPTGDSKAGQSQPAVVQMDVSCQNSAGSQSTSKAKPQAPSKTNKRKGSQGYMSVEGVHKLSRM